MAFLDEAFPDIAAEWDYSAAINSGTNPKKVKPGSGIKRGWVCTQCSLTWAATPHARTGANKTGCPGKCSKVKFNNTRFAKKREAGRLLKDFAPDIAAEWDYSAKVNQDISLDHLMAGDNRKLGWVCDLGHRWETSVGTRVTQGTGCPFCSKNKLLIGFNDFATIYPELAKQIHATRNTEDLCSILGAPKKKVWWVCEKGHEWKTTFDSRARGRGCPKCSMRQTSKIEKEFHAHFCTILANINPDHNFLLTMESGKKWKPDIYGIYKTMHIVVEYDGNWWHKNREDKDIIKTKSLLQENYVVVRIRENPLPFLKISDPMFFQIDFDYDKGSVKDTVETIIKELDKRKTNENY